MRLLKYFQENRPYCEHCYQDTVLPKCGGCKEPIQDQAVKALGKQWHVKCFACKVVFLRTFRWFIKEIKDCKLTFKAGSNFYSSEGKPVCGKCAGAEDDGEWGSD